jgi:hypothetical protein
LQIYIFIFDNESKKVLIFSFSILINNIEEQKNQT